MADTLSRPSSVSIRMLSRLALAAGLALVAGCGSGGASPGPDVTLPSVAVDDLAGGKLALSSLVPSQKPLLLWAWSPI